MVLHITCIGLLNSNFMMQIGAIIVIIPTSISTALQICDATSITEIAPIYNSELTMLDTMLLASIRFLFIVLFFSFKNKKERKEAKERKNLFFVSFVYSVSIAQRLRFNKSFFELYIYKVYLCL